MMKKLFTIALMAVGMTAAAQKPVLSPQPQSITWGDELTTLSDVTVSGVVGDEAVEAYASQVPEKAESYYLKLSAEGAVIVGRDERGLLYGQKTLEQLLGQDRANKGYSTTVYAAEVTDYPDVADRGVIEGFYGNPWSHQDRKRMFEFLADNKMNMYIYGPKDDPYHWGKWATLYPAAELSQLAELVTKAREEQVKFVWAVHPSESLTDAQMEQLRVKLEQLYGIGVRSFGIFFDDAGGTAVNHAAIINRMHEKFVLAHDDVEPIITVTSYYCDAFGGQDYQKTLAQAVEPNGVKVMWTGSGIMDMELTTSCRNYMNRNGAKPFIWHNWPVNDYSRAHLFMGKSDGMTSDLDKYICGYTSNPMEYAEASKVTVYSMADFCWNLSDYDADKSWRQSWQYMYPNSADEFGLFCQNSVETGSGRLVRTGEAAYFTAALNAGTPESELFAQIVEAAETLLADDSDQPVLDELKPFYQAFLYLGKRGALLGDMENALTAADPDAFIAAYESYNELVAAAAALQTHSWYGGSGFICPTIGTKVVGPYIEKRAKELASRFRNAGYDVPDGLFDPQVIPDGVYYIMYNGKYLTNSNPGAERTGDRPSFSTSELGATNPLSQQWQIELDPESSRFKITSVADGRYVNENGKFWADRTANAYSAAWNSYNIYRANGKHAIQNAGSAGDKFWTVSGSNIDKSSSNTLVDPANFIFEIVPVDGGDAWPVIESGKTYYIAYGNQLLTDNSTTDYPYFTDPTATSEKYQRFVINAEPTKEGRWNIYSGRAGSSHTFIRENGGWAINAYFADWNSHYILDCEGRFAIQNAENAGTNWWTVGTDDKGRYRLTTTGSGPHYDLEIITDWQAFYNRVNGVDGVSAPSSASRPAADAIYNLSGQRVGTVSRGLYIINGKKIIK